MWANIQSQLKPEERVLICIDVFRIYVFMEDLRMEDQTHMFVDLCQVSSLGKMYTTTIHRQGQHLRLLAVLLG